MSVTSLRSRAESLASAIASITIEAMHLKDCGLYGSYDLTRELIQRLTKQYDELREEEVSPLFSRID